MKRFFLLSLVAAFVSLMSVSAQDNTYSMIIKLANGTTLTIGPNEVDSISFNDGEITVAGSTINELVAEITKAQTESQARIDSLSNVVNRDLHDVMNMIANIQSCQCDMSNFPTKDEVADLINQYATMEESRIDSISNVLMMHYATMQDIMQALANIPIPDLSNYPTRAEITDLLSKYATREDLEAEHNSRKADDATIIDRMDAMDADHKKTEDTLKLEIDELKSMANALNAAVNAMNTRIDYLENEINKLKGN